MLGQIAILVFDCRLVHNIRRVFAIEFEVAVAGAELPRSQSAADARIALLFERGRREGLMVLARCWSPMLIRGESRALDWRWSVARRWLRLDLRSGERTRWETKVLLKGRSRLKLGVGGRRTGGCGFGKVPPEVPTSRSCQNLGGESVRLTAHGRRGQQEHCFAPMG